MWTLDIPRDRSMFPRSGFDSTIWLKYRHLQETKKERKVMEIEQKQLVNKVKVCHADLSGCCLHLET